MHVGKIAKAHSLHGELKLSTFDHDAPSIRVGVTLQIGNVLQDEITHVRRQPDGLLVRLKSIHTRDQADLLVGQSVHVAAEELPSLKDGEVWAFSLKGARVVDEAGNELGVVEDVLNGTAHDLLAIKTPQGVFEVPLVQHFVRKLDAASQTVVIRPIPGLLENDDEPKG